MRDPAIFDEIVRLLRDLWLRSPDGSIAQFIHSAVDPAVSNEVSETSDDALLRKLRAMMHFAAGAVATGEIAMRNYLAALDEARDENTASSHNWLRAELGRLREGIARGSALEIVDASGRIVLSSPAEFDEWARKRYPSA